MGDFSASCLLEVLLLFMCVNAYKFRLLTKIYAYSVGMLKIINQAIARTIIKNTLIELGDVSIIKDLHVLFQSYF